MKCLLYIFLEHLFMFFSVYKDTHFIHLVVDQPLVFIIIKAYDKVTDFSSSQKQGG